jgi:hypothetical protein
MHSSPSIVPQSDDQDVYLVLDDFGGRLGRAWRETDEALTDRATVITDLLVGQYSNPVRVITFNTVEGWSRDVSEDIADELAQLIAAKDLEMPPSLEDFIDRHGSGRPLQLPLPLKDVA